MVFGTLGRVDRARILATASRQTVRSAGKTPWQRFVVGCRCGGLEHDFVSSGDRRAHCRSSWRGMEAMKQRAIPIVMVAVVLLLVIAYLWGPSSVPAGQDRLVTLSNANLSEFAAAFDADSNVPRMLLLLSPT